MSLILSEYIEPFSACLIKLVCKIFDVTVTNTHCCSLAKNDPYADDLVLIADSLEDRPATIRSPHDMICIVIWSSRYDMYRDTS